MGRALLAIGMPALVVLLSAQGPTDQPGEILDRAIADFGRGDIASSVAGFDVLAKRLPKESPYLWQRGIALYYAGRFEDCRAQFELHRTVNPNDVENAAWHFACVARADSAARARGALLPVGPDLRRPMAEIYQMLRGSLTPAQVVAAAGRQPAAEFYAHLYAGLYLEAIGATAESLDQVSAAAASRYAEVGGYMHTVAEVHVALRRAGK
jgi:lipoprotein NlpI